MLVTRYNLRDPDLPVTATDRGIDRAWLESRLELFANYCVPSVKGSCIHPFEWVVFVSSETPTAALDAVRTTVAGVGSIELVNPGVTCREALKRYLAKEDSGTYDYVVTARLDNDDALSRDWLSRLAFESAKAIRDGQVPLVLNPKHGIVLELETGRAVHMTHKGSPFVALVEEARRARTVFASEHTALGRGANVKQIGGSPKWLQVVHGGNISNSRQHGVPVGPRLLARHFAISLPAQVRRVEPSLAAKAEGWIATQLFRTKRLLRRVWPS